MMSDVKTLPVLRWFLRDIPPAWMAVSALIMAALHHYVPLWQILDNQQRWFGFFPVFLSLLLTGAAAKTLARGGTTISPSGQPTALVENGIFRLTRNPMYLGMALMLLGFALFFGSVGALAGVVFFVRIIDKRFIAREEQRLQAAFGEDYRNYCQQTRRWI